MADSADSVALSAREATPGVVVIGVAGELDMATAPAVEEFVRRRLAVADRALALDLSGVTFCGSTGLTLLLDLRAACAAAGTELWLVAAGKAVLRPLELTDLRPHFTIVDTVAEAV